MSEEKNTLPVEENGLEETSLVNYEAMSLSELTKELKKLQAYDMTTCFLKTQSGLLEVPFARGIDMNLFCRLIPLTEIRKGYGKTRKMKDILAESHLCVQQNRVYIDIDRL